MSDESIHGKPDTLDTFAPWNPRQSCILDSISWIPDSRYCSPDSNPALYVFRNPKPRDFGFHSKISWIPESVHKRKFPRVRNPDSPTWREYFPWAAGRVISLQTSLIVNRSPLSVKRIPGFVFAFKTNARYSILCLDYIKVFANLAEAGDRLHNCCFCSGKVMLHGTIRNDDF